MPAVGAFSGTPASIKASDEPQTVAIEDEPFELGDLGDDADRIGEFRRRRQHRTYCAPGKLAVADLAPAWRAHAARLADGIGREVIVEQEALLVGAFERVNVLLVLAGAEGRNDQRLRLAARKQRRAMRARQNADLREDRTHGLHVAPVDADAAVENVPAHDLGLQIVESFADLLLGEFGAFGRQQRRIDLRLHGIDGLVAFRLGGDLIGLAQLRLGDAGDRRLDFALVGENEFARLFRRLFGKADDRVDDGLEATMASHHRFEHGGFRKLLGFQLDHQNGFAGAGDDEVERRILQLVDGRIDLQLAVDIADARAADRPHERDARERQRRRGRDHGENVGIVLEIVRKHGDDHLRVIAVAVGEERPDRPVDQARNQRLLFGGTPFALEITAGDAAGGEGLFLVIDGERKKVDARLRRLGGDDGGEDGGLAIGREHGAVRLAGDAPGFEHELAPGPIQFFTMDFEHWSFSSRKAKTQDHVQNGERLRA